MRLAFRIWRKFRWCLSLLDHLFEVCKQKESLTNKTISMSVLTESKAEQKKNYPGVKAM